MPLQNRVTPFGGIVAVPERGMFMGNRGRLHDNQGRIVRQAYSYKAWIVCLTEFKGRKRKLMSPDRYTELLFLDEATALAAGHRPCGECRRADFVRFKAAWVAGNSGLGLGEKPPTNLIDTRLHTERLTEEAGKRTYPATVGELPDGTFVCLPHGNGAFLIWKGRLFHWTPGRYDRVCDVQPDEAVDVLTPESTVNALRAGYNAVVHHSVR